MTELGRMGDQVRCQESLRVLLIAALDIIEPLKEKLDGYLLDPDGVDPHGHRYSWHKTAVSNLRQLLAQVVMEGPGF